MSDTSADLNTEDLPEGAKAAQELAADAAPNETSIGEGSADAEKLTDDVTPAGGVVNSGMPDQA